MNNHLFICSSFSSLFTNCKCMKKDVLATLFHVRTFKLYCIVTDNISWPLSQVNIRVVHNSGVEFETMNFRIVCFLHKSHRIKMSSRNNQLSNTLEALHINPDMFWCCYSSTLCYDCEYFSSCWEQRSGKSLKNVIGGSSFLVVSYCFRNWNSDIGFA